MSVTAVPEKPYFTVFTPVYNGEKHLDRVFNSIVSQTFRNFEWIIINDGSTDRSGDLIKSFLDNHPEIDAKYYEQSNSGKHLSWNRAVAEARGFLFIPADADDSFSPETLSFFYDRWNELSSEMKLQLSGINVLCRDNDSDNIVGTPFPADGMITNNVELEFRHRLKGEKWGCIRTDLLKNRPFPIIKGSHFPESYIWYHLSRKYKVVCFNNPLRRYYTTETGIMQSAAAKKTSRAQHKVNLKYYLWLNLNFGGYILRYSPRSFVSNTKVILGSARRLLFKY